MDAQELRERIRELLVPGGEPIGEPGERLIRRVPDDVDEAESLFLKLSELGELAEKPGHPGQLVQLGDEGTVGFRRTSKSGEPTIDVGLECVPEIRKIKFVYELEQ